MGIVNVTPDSFSDGGVCLKPAQAVRAALRMEQEGADLIDVGGESTRPGAKTVSARQELRRVLPVVERLSGKLRIPISVDTSKAVVAEAALKAGASLVNDVTALSDPRMAGVISRAQVPVILMHMKGNPRMMQKNPSYRDLIGEITAALQKAIGKAKAAGILPQKILIDPGLGFGKRIEDNWLLLKGIPHFKSLGFPVVVGPSRKSFIGKILNAPVEDRLLGTAACVAVSSLYGAHMVRVHDVKAMRDVLKVVHAIAGSSHGLS